MVLIKILKRKDASSVLVAVILALIISSFLASTMVDLSNTLAGLEDSLYGAPATADWKALYLQPFVLGLLQIAFLEVLAWVYIFVSSMLSGKK